MHIAALFITARKCKQLKYSSIGTWITDGRTYIQWNTTQQEKKNELLIDTT